MERLLRHRCVFRLPVSARATPAGLPSAPPEVLRLREGRCQGHLPVPKHRGIGSACPEEHAVATSDTTAKLTSLPKMPNQQRRHTQSFITTDRTLSFHFFLAPRG